MSTYDASADVVCDGKTTQATCPLCPQSVCYICIQTFAEFKRKRQNIFERKKVYYTCITNKPYAEKLMKMGKKPWWRWWKILLIVIAIVLIGCVIYATFKQHIQRLQYKVQNSRHSAEDPPEDEFSIEGGLAGLARGEPLLGGVAEPLSVDQGGVRISQARVV